MTQPLKVVLILLREIDADIVCLQEADRRFGARAQVIHGHLIDGSAWQAVPFGTKEASMGWHGNAILVRREAEVLDREPIFLPALEPRGAVMAALEAGKDVLFDIDWQGTQQLKVQAREDLASVFVLPPSKAELERRLRIRAQDSETVVRQRMAKASDELSHWAEYDYLLLNDDIQHAQGKLEEILRVERSRRARQPGLARFVQKLMRED